MSVNSRDRFADSGVAGIQEDGFPRETEVPYINEVSSGVYLVLGGTKLSDLRFRSPQRKGLSLRTAYLAGDSLKARGE